MRTYASSNGSGRVLPKRVEYGAVRDRQDVAAALWEVGLEVPRQGKGYLTSMDPATGWMCAFAAQGVVLAADRRPEPLDRYLRRKLSDNAWLSASIQDRIETLVIAWVYRASAQDAGGWKRTPWGSCSRDRQRALRLLPVRRKWRKYGKLLTSAVTPTARQPSYPVWAVAEDVTGVSSSALPVTDSHPT